MRRFRDIIEDNKASNTQNLWPNIGNSESIKEANLSKLKTVQSNDYTFFTDINYGYGTASWLPTTGGHAVKYTISIDGEEEFTLRDFTKELSNKVDKVTDFTRRILIS
jgi:hypothetical protein